MNLGNVNSRKIYYKVGDIELPIKYEFSYFVFFIFDLYFTFRVFFTLIILSPQTY